MSAAQQLIATKMEAIQEMIETFTTMPDNEQNDIKIKMLSDQLDELRKGLKELVRKQLRPPPPTCRKAKTDAGTLARPIAPWRKSEFAAKVISGVER